ncbi:MAG: hypothetical protein AAFU79_33675, partial [Myxococcota bacterium]
LSEVHAVTHMWLLKTSSGKIARAPNLVRFRAEWVPPSRTSAPPAPRFSPTLVSMAWGVAVGVALYVMLVLRPNLSWGIYAGF